MYGVVTVYSSKKDGGYILSGWNTETTSFVVCTMCKSKRDVLERKLL